MLSTVFIVKKLITPFAVSLGAVLVTNVYQRNREKQQYKEIWLAETREKQEQLIEELSRSMNRRYFCLRRVYWALCAGKPRYKLEDVDNRWNEYYDVVIEWNEKLLFNSNRIRRLTETSSISTSTTSLADKFYSVKSQTTTPKTLQDYFGEAHDIVLKCYRHAQALHKNKFFMRAKNAIPTEWDDWLSWDQQMTEALDTLKEEIDRFIKELHEGLLTYKIKGVQDYIDRLYQRKIIGRFW